MVCLNMWCYNKGDGLCYPRIAARGTTCGDGMVSNVNLLYFYILKLNGVFIVKAKTSSFLETSNVTLVRTKRFLQEHIFFIVSVVCAVFVCSNDIVISL